MNKRVAIIGTNPTGLTYADVLTRNGVEVTVYDRHPGVNDLLTFGIPSFKPDKSLLTYRREIFSAMGIHFELNCEMSKDISLNLLLKQYDAVFIDVGTYRSTKAGLSNEDVSDVYDALSFLIVNIRQVMGLEELPEEPLISTAGPNAVILGSDGTTMGCVHTALRHDASNATCAYCRSEANIPGSKKEVKNAHEEGVNFESNVQPMALELNERGHVCGIRFLRTRPGEPDAQGRWHPVPVEGSEFVMPTDAVTMMFGPNPHGVPQLESHGITVDRRSHIITDMENRCRYQTTNPRIFTGGDTVCGADLVITAMAEGCHAVQGTIGWLDVKSVKSH